MKKSIVKASVALSRNMDMYPFPAGLTYEASRDVEKIIIDAIKSIEDHIEDKQLIGMEESLKKEYYDKGLIPYSMMHNRIHSSIVSKEDGVFYRVNNEDHLEIVYPSSINDIALLWDVVSSKEELLSRKLNFAFDVKLGYLTSRITEIGTGLKIHVLLHLPGIVRTGYIKKLTQAVHQVGFSLKDHTSQGHSFGAEFYELSNLITIGKTEIELIEGIKELVERIEKKEADALETLKSAQDKVLEDEVYRAYGALQYARLITYDESILLLSKVRLGVNSGYFEEVPIEVIDTLLSTIRPFDDISNKPQLSKRDEVMRADYIRAHLYSK